MRVYVAESVSSEDFFEKNWEGHVVEEIVRLLGSRALYRIVMTSSLFDRALRQGSKYNCNAFHLSCHGNDTGICLTNGDCLSWDELAGAFEQADYAPSALILSSCLGGDGGAARAFRHHQQRPDVIFGSEAENDLLTFAGACVSWPILYTELETQGMTRNAFKEAVDKMNHIAGHQFVYWRWDDDRYRRYPRQG
jgi:hypothetical protein